MIWTLWNILLAAFGIGFLIFIHELGHFVMAKKVGIRVETFSIGFGPRLFGFEKGDTDYRISAIPLGGYVKMAGENPEEEKTGADDEYASKTVWERVQVITAGVIMNAVFGALAFIIAFQIGVNFPEPRVGYIEPNSVADGKLQRGDTILTVNGRDIIAFQDIAEMVAFADPEEELVLGVDRRGKRKEVRLKPRRERDQQYQQIGIHPMTEVKKVREDSAAAEAGVKEESILLDANGEPVKNIRELTREVFYSPGETFDLKFETPEGELVDRGVVARKKKMQGLGVTLDERPVIYKVIPDMAAEVGGLEPYDTLLEIRLTPEGEGERTVHVPTEDNLPDLVEASGGRPMELTVLRNGREVQKTVQATSEPGSDRYLLGIYFNTMRVKEVQADLPADRAGVKEGDFLLQLGELNVPQGFADGQFQVDNYLNRIDPRTGERVAGPLTLRWRSGDTEQSARVKPVPIDQHHGDLGLYFGRADFLKRSETLLGGVVLGLDRTWMVIKHVFKMLEGLLTSRVSAKALGGPLQISRGAYVFAQHGMGTLMYFLALLSINLAVLNILPIPILDGGHLMFLIIEKLKGEPVSDAVQAIAQYVGLVFLLGLMLWVTVNDFFRFISN